MIIMGLCGQAHSPNKQRETPPRRWRRAEDTINGGVNKETPPQRWRRAGDAIPGGVNR